MPAPDVIEAVEALRRVDVDPLIGGGWGVDALLGMQTRPHADLDIAVPAERLDDALAVLRTLGYVVTVDQRPARLVVAHGSREVDVHPVRWDATGAGLQEGLDGQVFVYPAGSGVTGRIADREVRCCSAELQMEFHEGYEPMERDRLDVEALAAKFGLPVPAAYSR
jgi:lincosamide nucleotidyltransferase A/C/D/E